MGEVSNIGDARPAQAYHLNDHASNDQALSVWLVDDDASILKSLSRLLGSDWPRTLEELEALKKR